jgi:hypothetical protein
MHLRENPLVFSDHSKIGLQAEIIDQPVRGEVMRKAFDILAFAGVDLHKITIDFLEGKGIILDNAHYYSLRQIERQLRKFYGSQLTPRLIEIIENEIHAQYYG